MPKTIVRCTSSDFLVEVMSHPCPLQRLRFFKCVDTCTVGIECCCGTLFSMPLSEKSAQIAFTYMENVIDQFLG